MLPNARLDSPYHYVPSETAAIVMITLFGLSTLLHTGQAIYYRSWFLFPTAILCGLLEIGGWSARLLSHFHPSSFTPFKIQICLTILAPTPLLAGTFIVFGRIIRRLGFQYSRLKPKTYMIVFCACDIASLVVQGVGGALAATAVGSKTGPGPDKGAHIMLGGIVFQLLTITVYAACATEYVYRYLKDLPVRSGPGRKVEDDKSDTTGTQSLTSRGELTKNIKIMLGALAFSTLCLFTRSVYRTCELANGWSGKIISTQILFIVLDGVMIIFGIWILNFVHPGLFLRPEAPKQVSGEKDVAY